MVIYRTSALLDSSMLVDIKDIVNIIDTNDDLRKKENENISELIIKLNKL